MSRRITEKSIQTHIECVCGYNEVDSTVTSHETIKQLRSVGIKRKICKGTKKVFYSEYYFIPSCEGHNEFED